MTSEYLCPDHVISSDKALLRTLNGKTLTPPPVWLMRQAGRFLPEYRKVRAEQPDFIEFCFTPDLAVKVTLQPIERFGFDAAIMFSDILVVPHALGQRVWFEEGVGPRLEPICDTQGLSQLSTNTLHETLQPVYETVQRLREDLPAEVALIGFAGAPWTVASYMIEGGSSRRLEAAKGWAEVTPGDFTRLIDLLINATSDYLIAQAEAGAEVLQLFDSWAAAWEGESLNRWCLKPATEIIRRVKAAHPDVPVILFPRGVGKAYEAFARKSGADALSLDQSVPLAWARDTLQPHVCLQGNLDPQILVAGGKALHAAVAEILETLGAGPFVFNLGHGIVPETPPEHVAELVAQVRAWTSGA